MRDIVTVVCFVGLLTGLGLAERFYLKWRTYVACSEVNLLVAQGHIAKTMQLIQAESDLLHVETIEEAVDLCRTEAS